MQNTPVEKETPEGQRIYPSILSFCSTHEHVLILQMEK